MGLKPALNRAKLGWQAPSNPLSEKKKEAMTSRAELLAELEENRQKNNEIETDLNEVSIAPDEISGGYDPYDNPSLGKEIPDGADITARRREIMLRNRKR